MTIQCLSQVELHVASEPLSLGRLFQVVLAKLSQFNSLSTMIEIKLDCHSWLQLAATWQSLLSMTTRLEMIL